MDKAAAALVFLCCSLPGQTEVQQLAADRLPLTVVKHETYRGGWGCFDFELLRADSRNAGFFVVGLDLLRPAFDLKVSPASLFRVSPSWWFPFGARFDAEDGKLEATASIHRFPYGGFLTMQWQRCWSSNMSAHERTVYVSFVMPRAIPWRVPFYVQAFTIGERTGLHVASDTLRLINHGIRPK